MGEDAPETFGSPIHKRILIVDDDALIRDLLELSVAGDGFQVFMAKDSAEAGAILDRQTIDLIITDLMMPGENGYEFMRRLGSYGAGRLPVVVVTASHLDPSTVSMMKQDANVVEFVNKPIKMTALLMALHRELKTIPPANRSRGLNDR